MLAQVPLFSRLSEDELEEVERQAVHRRYRARTVIIEQGDDAGNLFFLVQGRVKIFVVGEDSREVVLGERGPGGYVGELAPLFEGKRTASVATLEDSDFLVLTRQSFERFLQARPSIALALVRDLAKKVQGLSDDVSDYALLDVYGRIAKLLKRSAVEESGEMITAPLTHQDIADRVASSREMVSKILKDLRVGGYIEIVKKRIILREELPPRW